MTSTGARLAVIAAVVFGAAAVGAVYAAVGDGRQLRLENPLDPLPHLQAARARRMREETEAGLREIRKSINAYSEEREQVVPKVTDGGAAAERQER